MAPNFLKSYIREVSLALEMWNAVEISKFRREVERLPILIPGYILVTLCDVKF